MKQKILLSVLCSSIALVALSQKKVTAYAITGSQKGNHSWSEVRKIDVSTGDEIESIYKKNQQIALLNARTGKPVIKKEVDQVSPERKMMVTSTLPDKKDENGNPIRVTRLITLSSESIRGDLPFATNSAACAYDKKHDRLYYTPMGINQLRYIDLKSKTPKIFYFEDEPFGALSSRGDVSNQVTRMVIGADGNGYALTNNAQHLIRFNTNKKATVTDLGPLSDDASNGAFSIRSQSGYGGDIVAHSNGDLYLVTANRRVFQISVENKTAKYLGDIKGLPRGFTTNGAMVDEGMSVIVCSSNSTQGYFRFDINKLQAEKVSGESAVYNASDLANGNLLTEKKKKKKDLLKEEVPQEQEVKPTLPVADVKKQPTLDQLVSKGSISIYPNPVTTGVVRLSFKDQPEGKYKIQFMDISGKLVSQQEVTINNKVQVQEIRLPSVITAGNYLIKVVDQNNQLVSTEKLVVQQ
jgi:hypothetical protein